MTYKTLSFAVHLLGGWVKPSGLFGQNQLCSTSLPSSFDCCTHWELFDILKIWLWWLWRIWLSQFVWQSLQPPQQLCLSLSILEIGDIFNTFKSKVVENVEVTKKIWILIPDVQERNIHKDDFPLKTFLKLQNFSKQKRVFSFPNLAVFYEEILEKCS